MLWMYLAAGFAFASALLWLRLGPGPRWPLLLLFPAAAISLLYLASHLLQASGEGAGLDLFLASPAGHGLFVLRAVCLLLALVLARGARAFVITASLALLSLDAGLVSGVISMFDCAHGSCGAG